MTRPSVFNTVAQNTKKELAPYERAIALMKDLQDNWGPDGEGRRFIFEIFQNPYYIGKPIMILGSYASKKERASGMRIPALLLGVPPDDIRFNYAAHIGCYQRDGAPHEKAHEMLSLGASYRYFETAKTVHKEVVDFVKMRMSGHPRYKEAVQSATAQALKKIKPVSPV